MPNIVAENPRTLRELAAWYREYTERVVGQFDCNRSAARLDAGFAEPISVKLTHYPGRGGSSPLKPENPLNVNVPRVGRVPQPHASGRRDDGRRRSLLAPVLWFRLARRGPANTRPA